MSSGCRAAPGTVAFFGGMSKVNALSNVGHLFSNAINQEQGNTIVSC
jgi:hypothetical protein